MRVWDCDPVVLADKHLSAQHGEIHFAIRCVEGGWKTRWKDVDRFRGKDGVEWLGFVHDATVEELKRRGKFAGHRTHVVRVHTRAFLEYFADEVGYMEVLAKHGYPPTQLNEATPWERDGTSFAWYRANERTYSRAAAAAAREAGL